jgi:hypothetical protein
MYSVLEPCRSRDPAGQGLSRSLANRFFRERFGESHGKRCYEYLFNRAEPCEICETYTVLRTNAPHHWYWTGPDKRDYDIYDYPFVDSDGSKMILEMGIDITEQKQAQEALRETITELREATHRAELTTSLLALITQKNTRREYLDATCDLLQSWSGLKHVGIRVTGPNREIPFESCKGYANDFLEQENDLSLAEDRCICTRIISGAPEPPDLRSMTPKGSFYSGDALAFIGLLNERERSHYRGTCMKHRYRSLAVIPILYRGRPVGAIHLADEQPDMLPLTTVDFLEQLAQIIGEAIYRFGVEEERCASRRPWNPRPTASLSRIRRTEDRVRERAFEQNHGVCEERGHRQQPAPPGQRQT